MPFTKGHGLVGAIVYDTSHHHLWSRALRGMEDFLQVNGYNLIIGNDDGNFEKASNYISNFTSLPIDGFIFVPIGCSSKAEYEKHNLELIDQIESAGLSYVVFHRLIDTYNTTAVTLDDYHDTVLLMKQFLKRKIKHPVCLFHYYTSCTALRERGFVDALSEIGISDSESHKLRIQPACQKVDSRLQDQIAAFLHEKPEVDGIFAVENDILNVAIQIVKDNKAFDSRKIRFSCFDYSGTIDINDVSDIMDVPIYEMG